ncbi:HI1506-related protein [Pseudomonas nicosulfuronedens]|uniref:HI1506-related protein n=1 Tax=Pseudomonas nicosulfuronedens TaxID=2571105 RepID=UPI0024482F18|nr:HI1506-related protein [Pseudomonas nicosulfuronedens]MDH1009350.1 HI1506-related protein [Pseudomonas nicosulfuronedens]MDH1978700.1 HI1506-related protein [Pseudomonas nicosulfuronedens]MDH2026438.1 HI1506-related protein [Pseudomonas nicosulfuronedens]
MGVRITARTDGFRRCGVAHLAKGKTYRDGYFTEEQLEALRSEPQLVVVDVDDEQDDDDENDGENLAPASSTQAPTGSEKAPAVPAQPRAAAAPVRRGAAQSRGKGKEKDKSGADDKDGKDDAPAGDSENPAPGAEQQA